MNTVYMVTDLETQEVISIHATFSGAQQAILEYLKKAYTWNEWEELAHASGFHTVDEFYESIASCSDHNEYLLMEAKAVKVEE